MDECKFVIIVKLTDLQIELIKTFSILMFEETVQEIKDKLSDYFLQNMDTELDKLIVENNWTDKTFEDWSNEHNRISSQLIQPIQSQQLPKSYQF